MTRTRLEKAQDFVEFLVPVAWAIVLVWAIAVAVSLVACGGRANCPAPAKADGQQQAGSACPVRR